MKRILGLILVLCLVFSVAAECFAAGKPEFKKQPQSATTNKKGTVKFSCKVTGAEAITWYFVNPATGEKISGKKLVNTFPKIKVSNPNSQNITLKKVPDEMHGWYVYCHVAGGGYKTNSKMVVLNIYGKDPAPEPENADDIPEAAPAPAPAAEDSSSTNNSKNTKNSKNSKKKQNEPEPFVDLGDGTAKTDDGYLLSTDDENDKGIDRTDVEIADKPITVTASAKVLYKVSSLGKVEDTEPSKTLDFINSGNFLVKSEDPIKKWTINGMRIEPAEPVYEFKVMNVTSSVSLNLTIARTAASQNLDTSNMVNVTCEGCTFTFMPSLISVSSGSVPAGANITVISKGAPDGYSINGAAPEHAGKVSFRLQVTEDTVITLGGAAPAPAAPEAEAELTGGADDDAEPLDD